MFLFKCFFVTFQLTGWVWVGECLFWYRPTRVVPDQRPLNGRCCFSWLWQPTIVPSVLWHCSLDVRKSIRPVKIEWCGYLSWARCRLFACGPADATAIPKPPSSLASLKSRLVLPFCCWLTQVVMEERPLTGCSSSSSSGFSWLW